MGRHPGGMIQSELERRSLVDKGGGHVWDIPGISWVYDTWLLMGNMRFGTVQDWQESSPKTAMMSSAVRDPKDYVGLKK